MRFLVFAILLCGRANLSRAMVSQSYVERCQAVLNHVSEVGESAHFTNNHWTVSDTGSYFSDANGKLSADILDELTAAVELAQQEIGGRFGRFPVFGLSSTSQQPTKYRSLTGLSPQILRRIDNWAEHILRLTEAATVEKLRISEIKIGVDFRVGRMNPIIHVDDSLTYIHGILTLRGPGTMIWQHDESLEAHELVEYEPLTGTAVLRNAIFKTDVLRRADAGVGVPEGHTAIVSGYQYVYAGKDRVGTLHSSPLVPQPGRLTLFVDVQPVPMISRPR